ncbi:GM15820 [Drosophila sechellia]|uniref:GM15820 n=1 Tax=Drosophila sechellia TaxID=7238 RepID=B4I7M3_DROSE|nr:GM15820 [Drosophila sechellia]
MEFSHQRARAQSSFAFDKLPAKMIIMSSICSSLAQDLSQKVILVHWLWINVANQRPEIIG